MYCTCRKGCLLGIGVVALAIFVLIGFSGRVMQTSTAQQRELPIYSVDTPEKRVALGINCAWDDSDIDSFLSILQEHNAKATFFLVGSWCDQYPDSVRKLAQAGMELGSHSNTHPDMVKLDRAQIEDELRESGRKIAELTGQVPHLFRAPSGSYNNLVVSTARELGWEVIQWDCDTIDWKGGEADTLLANAKKRLQNGSILLLHVGAPHTLEALPALLDMIEDNGYELVRVGELIYEPPYTIDHQGRQHTAAQQ